ncbi:MAG: histidine--tRNA ligase [Candidatus Aenigmarchaeota archaeon]|nr:histidine--tRNA ligase [Candidatus Aenigmarchaeota archaeon]
MEAEVLKGTKNYIPEEQVLREDVIEIIRKALQKYGFNPIETSVLQPYALLSSKYGGGEEILKECYRLKDMGDRELGLRYELTITLAAFLLENPGMKMPFRRYEIGKVFRDGPVKQARIREFTQFDFDIVGAKSGLADIEILAIYENVFRKLGLDVEIQLNNRKILFAIMEYAGIDNNSETQASIILTIDKLEKIGKGEVSEELIRKGLNEKQINKIFEVLDIKGSNEEIITKLSEMLTSENGKEGVEELKKLIELAKAYDLKNIILLPSLARGLGYYTGSIYEVFLKNKKVKSSLAAGGRFDKMISNFVGKDLPAVGGSFGLDAICSALEPKKKSNAQVYVIPIGLPEEKFLPIVKKLRETLNVDFDLSGRGISKNLDYANKNKIPYCIFVGKRELEENKLKLKDMDTGEEKTLSLEEIINLIKKSK